jgi:hypothetical protein
MNEQQATVNQIAIQTTADLTIQEVSQTVSRYYPSLVTSVKAMLSVFGAMALGGGRKPVSLMFETPSGFGKSTVLQMGFPLKDFSLDEFAYRSDQFTPKSFVSHLGGDGAKEKEVDMLPKLKDKVLICKELATMFRGRSEDLEERFKILIAVLDGEGFISDSGMVGRHGYDTTIRFNWIGATTPLPPETHRVMSWLGTRLLFFQVPAQPPTLDELAAFAEKDEAGEADLECRRIVNQFLCDFFRRSPVGTVEPKEIEIPKDLNLRLVQWARVLVNARARISYERNGSLYEPVAADPAEAPFRVVNYFKDLVRGHALIEGRMNVNQDDLNLVAEIALSSIPSHIRPLVRAFQDHVEIDSRMGEQVCNVSRTTAVSRMKELELLGLVQRAAGNNNTPSSMMLANEFQWLNQKTLLAKRNIENGQKQEFVN